jgi:hypothetical protein
MTGTAEPLFMLAPPRSFTTVVCAMIGEHPQMLGLPETNLFARDSYVELRELYSKRPRLQHGLLRSVAQLGLGGQSAVNIEVAKRWLRAHARASTADLFSDLVAWAAPRRLVDKSPIYVYSRDNLARIQRTFPDAYFLHLLRHPRGTCESMHALRQRTRERGQGRRRPSADGQDVMDGMHGDVDPDRVWLSPHRIIVEFLKGVPAERQLRLRGEDLLASPDAHVGHIAAWLGVDTSATALERMKHPEESPFACFGPPNARFGDDPSFLEKPWLRPYTHRAQDLDGPLSWNPQLTFSAAIKELAQGFGY